MVLCALDANYIDSFHIRKKRGAGNVYADFPATFLYPPLNFKDILHSD